MTTLNLSNTCETCGQDVRLSQKSLIMGEMQFCNVDCLNEKERPTRIKATLSIYYSKRDMYGNCYFAFTYQDNATGKKVNGTISGGESNIRGVVYCMGFEHNNVATTCQQLPIREFNRFTKTWEYAGCLPEDMAVFIKNNLTNQ